MPEVTQVQIDFIIDDARAKGQLAELRAEGEKTIAALKKVGLTPETLGTASLGTRELAGVKAFREGLEEVAASEQKVKAAADEKTAAISKQSTTTERETSAVRSATGATNELSETTKGARTVFDQFEGVLNRVVIRMAAMEVVMGTIRLIGSEFKNAWDLATTEAQFKNLYGDTEKTKQAFFEIEAATKQDAKAAAEVTTAIKELGADGTRELDEVTAEALKLQDASQALKIPYQQLTSEIAQIRETGQITFSELYKLNEQTGGKLREGVEWWRWYDNIIKQTEEDIRKQDKAEGELAKTAEARERLEERAADAAQKGADRAADAQEKAADRAADAQEKAADRAADAQEKAYDREVDAAQKAADRKADIASKEADSEADAIQSIRDRARAKGQRIGLTGEESRAQILGQREYALAGARGTPEEYQREGERVQRQQRAAEQAAQLAAREETERAQHEARDKTESDARQAREDKRDAERIAREDKHDADKEARDAAKEAAREAKENARKDRADQLDDLKQRQKDFKQGQTARVVSPEFLAGMKGQAEATQPWNIVGTQFKEGMDSLKKGSAEDGKMIADKIQDLINIFQGAH
jgi:hypothetical protein